MFEQVVQVLEKEPWYQDIKVLDDKFIFYVKYINKEVNEKIPCFIEGKQVLVHFANIHAKRETYVLKSNDKFVTSHEDKAMLEILKMRNRVNHFIENVCGSNIIRDIFFEIVDKDNALTNLSAVYPEVRKELDNDYKIFGFDVLYKELGC